MRIYIIYSMIEKAPFGKGRVLRFRHRRLAVTGERVIEITGILSFLCICPVVVQWYNKYLKN